MIIYLLLSLVKTIFLFFLASLKTIFPSLWTAVSNGLSTLSTNAGFKFGVGVMDTVLGNTFFFYFITLLITVHITIRIVRLIIGFFAK
jgi:hypothetical protein